MPRPPLLDILNRSVSYLVSAGVDTPRLDAELLLCKATGLDRLGLYVNFDRPMKEDELASLRPLLRRRRGREPVGYITGGREFYGRRFEVGRGVFIPRPETEVLVEEALGLARSGGRDGLRILDIGTGSGAIGLTLSIELPGSEVVAVDASAEAAAFARRNAALLGVDGRVSIIAADLLSAVREGALFDIIVSNPPYIPSGEISALEPEVSRHEPRVALDGGRDGLAVFSRLVFAACRRLAPGGRLVVEIGAGQAAAAGRVLAGCNFSVLKIKKDYSGIERVVVAKVV